MSTTVNILASKCRKWINVKCVCLSVCVGHNLELWWNGWTDWVAVWGMDLDEPVKPCGVVWVISQHQLCLPKVAHLALAFAAWLRSSESIFRLLTHFAFGNRLIPNASSCLLRTKLHKVPAVLRETWQGAWIPRGKGQFWGCPQWCIAKNGGGYTQRGLAKGLKLPCLFMITEVSIRCQKNLEVGIRRIPAYNPQYTTGYPLRCCRSSKFYHHLMFVWRWHRVV